MTGWSVYVCACALVVITKEPIENRAPSNFLGSDIDTAPQGSFSNYMGMILAFLCPPPYFYVDSFTLHVDKNGHFWITYPPHPVHVVIERPLTAVT